MTVLGNNIVIKPDEKEKSIIITEEEHGLEPYATVVLVGKEVREVKEGDRVYFNNKSGRFISIDDVDHVMVTEHDIFIIL